MNLRTYTLAAWVMVLQGCTLDNTVPPDTGATHRLTLIQTIQLDIQEPSGLTYDRSDGSLYTVNDPPNNRVYQISTEGRVLEELSYVGIDLEGVSVLDASAELAVLEEKDGRVMILGAEGDQAGSHTIDYPIESDNSGFEGICQGDASDGGYFILREYPPVVLHLDDEWQLQRSIPVTFSTDVSGICPGRAPHTYFILGDEDHRLFEWHSQDGLLAVFKLDIPQPEGVAYDLENDIVYIVCDQTARLYSYRLESL